MPALEPADQVAAKNNIRRRATADVQSAPMVQRASRPRPYVADTDESALDWPQRTTEDSMQSGPQRITEDTVLNRPMPSQVLIAPPSKAVAQTPRPRTTQQATSTTQPDIKTRRQAHPLLFLSIGMVAMVLLWMGLSAIWGWFNTTLDDIHYGRPRTFQIDVRVGHNDQTGLPSHFIALNLHRHIQIIEIQGGDPAHTRIYTGPQLYGANDDLTPILLSFLDVNGDHKPDMIVTFQGSRVVFINDQGGFRVMQPAEHEQVDQFLLHHGG